MPATIPGIRRKLAEPNHTFKRIHLSTSPSRNSKNVRALIATVVSTKPKPVIRRRENIPEQGTLCSERPETSLMNNRLNLSDPTKYMHSTGYTTKETMIHTEPCGDLFGKSMLNKLDVGEVLLQFSGLFGSCAKDRLKLLEYVKISALKLLPSKEICIALKDFYLKYVDYIYHPLHHETFNTQFNRFLECLEIQKYSEIDTLWVSLLLLILSVSLLHLPKQLTMSNKTFAKFRNQSYIKKLIHTWASAAIELYHMGKDDSNHKLIELQIFSVFQLYSYATKQAEKLSSFLVMSVNTAYALELNKADYHCTSVLEREMRRRLWWDVCGCDTFLALCHGRAPLIRSYLSNVPFPKNVNDKDIGNDFIEISDDMIPTDNSFNIHRAKMMKILNGLFEIDEFNVNSFEQYGHSSHLFRQMAKIDSELCSYLKRLPWYFKLDKHGNLPGMTNDRLKFQFHMLHICICVHRIRIYRSYLDYNVPIAWNVCLSAACSMLNVYKKLRGVFSFGDKNDKDVQLLGAPIIPYYFPMIHQTFTGSVSQTMLLLKMTNGGPTQTSMGEQRLQRLLFHDIELFLNDLEFVKTSGVDLPTPVLEQSFKGLKMLHHLCKSLKMSKNVPNKKHEQEGIIDNVSDVFGGRRSTEGYLKKFSVEFIVNNSTQRHESNCDADPARLLSIGVDKSMRFHFDYSNQFGTMISENSPLLTRSLKYLDRTLNPQSLKEECTYPNVKVTNGTNPESNMHGVEEFRQQSSSNSLSEMIGGLSHESGSRKGFPLEGYENLSQSPSQIDNDDTAISRSEFGDFTSQNLEDLTNLDFLKEWFSL